MTTHPSLQLLLAAGPEAPGAAGLLERASGAASLRVMLMDEGLRWLQEERLASLAATPGVEISLCSRSAREHGVVPEKIPAWVRWSSVVRWLLDRRPQAPLWSALP